MTNELANIIIGWHFDECVEHIELDPLLPHEVIDEYADIIDIEEVGKANALPKDVQVLIKRDLNVNSQDDEIEQAFYLIDNYDETKDLYCLTIMLENDFMGNKQGYRYLLQ